MQSRWLFTTNEYTLKEKELLVKEASLLKRRSFSVPFEMIPNDFVEVSTSSTGALSLLGLAALIGLSQLQAGQGASFLWAVLPLGIWYWASRVTYLVYNCGDRSLVLFKDSPSEEAVEEFIETVQNQKQAYLRATYVGTQTGSLADELRKLSWLKDNDALTQEEFDQMKASLLSEITKPRGQIGFIDPSSAT
jgi:hypothetical protein